MSKRKPALRRRRRTVPRGMTYARAVQKVWYAQKPTPAEARELRRNRMPDGTYPLRPLVRPEASSR